MPLPRLPRLPFAFPPRGTVLIVFCAFYLLPGLIDGMTPQGQVPQGSGDLVSQALAILNQSKTG